MTLRVAFMGTPDFAVPALEAIRDAGHEVPAVFTRAPARSGRGMKERPSPVGALAARHGLPVLTPASAKREPEAFAAGLAEADVAIVVAYGLLLPPAVLATPRLGCLNLHASLLPRWRGAAPIHRAVLAGDRETGVAVMRMEAGLDTGPLALEARAPIGPDDTTGDLHDRLAARGAALLVEALAGLEAGTLRFAPQAEAGVTYAAKLTNDEARIDWTAPAARVHDHVRGLSPFPGAFFTLAGPGAGERVKVLRTALADGAGAPGTAGPDGIVHCGEGAVRLLRVQRAGGAPTDGEAFARGLRLRPGNPLAAP